MMLYHTKLDFDCGLFLHEYENLKHNEKLYKSPRGTYAHWKVIRNEDMTSKIVTDFTYNIQRMFSMHGKVDGRFYKLDANQYLAPHMDNKTQCCLNFILNDNPAPITIQDIPYTYKQALINTRMSHSVRNGNTDRILFRISIFHVCFDEVKEIMDHHGFLE